MHIWTAKPGELCVDYLALAQEFLRARSRGTQRRELASHLVFNLERIAFPADRNASLTRRESWLPLRALTAIRETEGNLVCYVVMLQYALRVGVHMYVDVLTQTHFHCQLYGARTKHRSQEGEAERAAGSGPKHRPCLREVPNRLQTLGCSSQLHAGSPTRRSSTLVGMHAPVHVCKV